MCAVFDQRRREIFGPYHSGGNAYTAAIRKVRDLTSDDLPQQSRIDELNELAKTWRSGFDEEPPAPKQVTSSSKR